MTPGNIIKKALSTGLDVIAITDHNSARNVEVAMELAAATPLKIIPGMEVESAEEVHLLCLFERLEDLFLWEEIVYRALPEIDNDEDYFGYQLITDRNDEYIAKESRLLATATELTIDDIVKKVTGIGGVVIPSHIDRPYNSLIANLGFIPPELKLPVLEVSRRGDPESLMEKYPFLEDYSLITNSDCHLLNDLGSGNKLKLKDVSLNNLITAIQRKE
jgi:hypothetical protein